MIKTGFSIKSQLKKGNSVPLVQAKTDKAADNIRNYRPLTTTTKSGPAQFVITVSETQNTPWPSKKEATPSLNVLLSQHMGG